jgi:hypothetical protein
MQSLGSMSSRMGWPEVGSLPRPAGQILSRFQRYPLPPLRLMLGSDVVLVPVHAT